MECNEFGRLMFDGKIVYCKDGDGLIPYWQGVTEEGLEKLVRDYAERGTEGFADFIICQNGEVLETIGDYCKRMNIPGDPGGPGSASSREDGWRLHRIFVSGQERHAGSGDALGAPVQPCGEPLQRDLPGTVTEHHSAHLPPHLL